MQTAAVVHVGCAQTTDPGPCVSLLWNRVWTAICDVKPALDLPVDNDSASLLPLACYDCLQAAPAHAMTPAPQVVYVPLAALKDFLAHVWPLVHARARIVLVTGRSDRGPAASLGLPTLPRWDTGKGKGQEAIDPAAAPGHLRDLLHDDRLLAWWSENLDFTHPKCHPLPIGLDLHTLASAKAIERPFWGCPASPAKQVQDLLKVREAALPAMERDARIFVHFGLVNRRRLSVLQCIKDHPCYSIAAGMPGATAPVTAGKEGQHHVSREQLWRDMAKYRWVASIEGYGLDCHRTWEALSLGCGVVVQDVAMLREVLKGFPVLFVPGSPSAWATYVTHTALEEAWARWQAEQGTAEVCDSPGLAPSHWVNRIRTEV